MNKPLIAWITTVGTLVLVMGYIALPRTQFALNTTRSVPIGIYRIVPLAEADFVRFCLARGAAHHAFYIRYCSPDNPDGPRILKRIHGFQRNGDMLVRGDHPRAIDSKIIGPVTLDQQRDYWRALITFNERGANMQNDAMRECPANNPKEMVQAFRKGSTC
jgi:type IV secretory pathway protease TraF